MNEAKEVLARLDMSRPMFVKFEFGSAGTILDPDGRVICTMNLQDLTLGEAFQYAAFFMAAPMLAFELDAMVKRTSADEVKA